MADTTLSNFPAKVDSFDRVSDLDKATLKKSEIYKEKIDSGDYTGAEQYLNDNPDLGRCAINATIINKHSDAIVALENEAITFKSEVSQNLTKVNEQDKFSTTSGTGTAFTATCPWYNEQKYIVGQKYTIRFHMEGGGNATLNINNLGAVPIICNNEKSNTTRIRAFDILVLQYNNFGTSYGFYVIGQIQNWGLTVPQTGDESNIEYITPTLNKKEVAGNSIKLKGSGGTKLSRESDDTIIVDSFEFFPSDTEKRLGTFYKTYPLQYMAFHVTSFNNSPDGYIYIPNTDWYATSGLSKGAYDKFLVGIDGVLIKKDKTEYPFGYNDGTISVNAYFGKTAVSPYDYMIIVSYKGISKSDIMAVRGILKYTTELA